MGGHSVGRLPDRVEGVLVPSGLRSQNETTFYFRPDVRLMWMPPTTPVKVR